MDILINLVLAVTIYLVYTYDWEVLFLWTGFNYPDDCGNFWDFGIRDHRPERVTLCVVYYEYRARYENYSKELLAQELGYKPFEEMIVF